MTEEGATPPEETRFRRGIRYTHRGALYASAAVVILTLVYLILLIAKNTRQVKLDYVFGSGRAALIWLIIVSAVTGWVLGLATSYLVRRRTRRPH